MFIYRRFFFYSINWITELIEAIWSNSEKSNEFITILPFTVKVTFIIKQFRKWLLVLKNFGYFT